MTYLKIRPSYDRCIDGVGIEGFAHPVARVNVTEDMKSRTNAFQFVPKVRASQVDFSGSREVQNSKRGRVSYEDVDSG